MKYTVHSNTIKNNILKFKEHVKHNKIILSLKSLPIVEAVEKISELVDGFEISNQNEYELIQNYLNNESIVIHTGYDKIHDHRIIRSCPYPIDDRHFLRVNSVPLLTDGFFLDKDLVSSRFGSDTIKTNLSTEGIHFHLGRTIDHSFYPHRKCFDKIVSSIDEQMSINLGGSWHRVANLHEELEYFSSARENLIFELGRIISINAVELETTVLDIYYSDGIYNIILDASHELHCKWSDKISCNIKSGNDLIKVSGSTCYERDVFSVIRGDISSVNVGDDVLINGLNGYCIAWNNSFNGVGQCPAIVI